MVQRAKAPELEDPRHLQQIGIDRADGLAQRRVDDGQRHQEAREHRHAPVGEPHERQHDERGHGRGAHGGEQRGEEQLHRAEAAAQPRKENGRGETQQVSLRGAQQRREQRAPEGGLRQKRKEFAQNCAGRGEQQLLIHQAREHRPDEQIECENARALQAGCHARAQGLTGHSRRRRPASRRRRRRGSRRTAADRAARSARASPRR